MIALYALEAAVLLGVLWLGTNLRVVKQYERGVVFRFGRVQTGVRGPGLTWLRSIIGKSDLDDLLSNREGLNQGMELMIDSPALGWGVHIDRVEIKDVVLPDSMKRSMSRQAEAERERRARIITADGELQVSENSRRQPR